MKRYIKFSSNLKYLPKDVNILYEDDHIVTIEYSSGIATYDKHNGALLSWKGENVHQK